MKLTAHLVWRQGVSLRADATEVGYFACGGIDAAILLCTLELLCRRDGSHLEVEDKEWKELREWINGPSVPDS